MIYQVKDDKVYIEYVVDGRQDYQWLLTHSYFHTISVAAQAAIKNPERPRASNLF